MADEQDASPALATLTRTYEELKVAKARKRDLNQQLKDELTQTPGYDQALEELTAAREKMKLLKVRALEASGLEPDIEDAKQEVKALQEVMDSLMANAVAQGIVEPGRDVQLGNYKVTPRLKVSFKQLSLEL